MAGAVATDRRVSGMAPVFVSGRQHSGNTVLSLMLAQVPSCFSRIDENDFFEHRGRIDELASLHRRVDAVWRVLRLWDDVEDVEEIQAALAEWATRHEQADALDIYLEAMRIATTRGHQSWWAQKATSYIFYADEILDAVRDARIIYTLRNPYDLAASRKRRFPYRDPLYGTARSWNQGMRIAERLQAAAPDRFRLVRYEDLVATPESTAAELFEFLEAPFTEECLQVPHVNPSESRYSLTGSGQGLTTSRVNYYVDVLSGGEIGALDALLSREYVARYYPQLAHSTSDLSRRHLVASRTRRLVAPVHYGSNYAWRMRKSPRSAARRTLRRLR